MPSTYAHHRMGQEVIKQVSAPARDIIMKHKQLYDIGLHGPDILFYYHPLVTNPVNAIGYGLHERSGKYFFGKAAEIIEKASDKEGGTCLYLWIHLPFCLGFHLPRIYR